MRKKETICAHTIVDVGSPGVAATSVIMPSTAYSYQNTEELLYPGFFSTYNQKRLGALIAALDCADYGLVFNSGMSAISTVILSLVKEGDHIIFSKELYGGTWNFATEDLPQRGIDCSFAANSTNSFQSLIQQNTRLVYIESPSNPLLSIIDVAKISEWAKKNGLITVIDNTLASPINQQPLCLGFDIVIHSGTKYLSGHNDLTFGAIVTNKKEYFDFIKGTAKLYGGSLSPQECYMAERSIKTLAIRVERQNTNAGRIALFLENHPLVKNTYYPGLTSHKGHNVAKKQMTGFGGMVSFELDTDTNGLLNFLSGLTIIQPALSLGGVESLISVPSATSHSSISKDQRGKMGINDNLLRLSVGIENVDDLIEDIAQALKELGKLQASKGN